jgi:cell wall assembly regulator SMI1
MYPLAPTMPPTVSTAIEDLLARHEAFLKEKVPTAFSALQPGLSDSQIDALEAKYGLKLTSDLRALYRWHNGTNQNAFIDVFPNHSLVSLEVALLNRERIRSQVRQQTPELQKVHADFAGHRDAWVEVIVDPAGDGHFYDPGRAEPDGSFFYCFAEDGNYFFYPAFRNYLAAIVECEERGLITANAQGVTVTDYSEAQSIRERFGAAPRR